MSDLKRWSQDEISRMRSEVDRLFDDLCADFDLPLMVCRMTGDMTLSEEGNALVVCMELGNINPDDVQVSVLDRLLVVAAESVAGSVGSVHSRVFRKELKLPCVIDTSGVRAEFKDGVLTVRLPKCASPWGQRVKITRK